MAHARRKIAENHIIGNIMGIVSPKCGIENNISAVDASGYWSSCRSVLVGFENQPMGETATIQRDAVYGEHYIKSLTCGDEDMFTFDISKDYREEHCDKTVKFNEPAVGLGRSSVTPSSVRSIDDLDNNVGIPIEDSTSERAVSSANGECILKFRGSSAPLDASEDSLECGETSNGIWRDESGELGRSSQSMRMMADVSDGSLDGRFSFNRTKHVFDEEKDLKTDYEDAQSAFSLDMSGRSAVCYSKLSDVSTDARSDASSIDEALKVGSCSDRSTYVKLRKEGDSRDASPHSDGNYGYESMQLPYSCAAPMFSSVCTGRNISGESAKLREERALPRGASGKPRIVLQSDGSVPRDHPHFSSLDMESAAQRAVKNGVSCDGGVYMTRSNDMHPKVAERLKSAAIDESCKGADRECSVSSPVKGSISSDGVRGIRHPVNKISPLKSLASLRRKEKAWGINIQSERHCASSSGGGDGIGSESFNPVDSSHSVSHSEWSKQLDRSSVDEGVNYHIVDVWNSNLHQEFSRILSMVEKYPYIALDTEFPGIVAHPSNLNAPEYSYRTLKCNVDLLKVIQLGITFSDENGRLAEDPSTWQFNFRFDTSTDMYAYDSIEFLRSSGVNFEVLQEKGIDPNEFGELIMSSGLVMNDNVRWISYHGCYDFGYMIKLLTCAPLPHSEKRFHELISDFFPCLYDIKCLLRNSMTRKSLKCNSLQGLSQHLGVVRIGQQHQAGSDSLVTCCTFFRLLSMYRSGGDDYEQYAGMVYGLERQILPVESSSSSMP